MDIDRPSFQCRKCGKNMRNPKTGEAYVGISINVIDNQNDPETSAFIKKQVGDFDIGNEYAFCFECLIKSIMREQP